MKGSVLEMRRQTILRLGACGRCGGSGTRCEDAIGLLVDCRCCGGAGSHAEVAVADAYVDECYRGLHGADEGDIPNSWTDDEILAMWREGRLRVVGYQDQHTEKPNG